MEHKDSFIVGIDASNIRHGGGITHLSQILRHTNFGDKKIKKVFVWSNQKTLSCIEDRPWLQKRNHPLLEGSLIKRAIWQMFLLKSSLKRDSCSVLFVLGGTFYTRFKPIVTFHQNLLPFESKEILRYGFSLKILKFFLLRIVQSLSFIRSQGIIFLSNYSKKIIEKKLNRKFNENQVIAHGIESRFRYQPKKQKPIDSYSFDNPFRMIYVSSIDYYKHQWNVVEAVSLLRNKGYPVELRLYGIANSGPKKFLDKSIKKFDPEGNFILFEDEVDFNSIDKIYKSSDLSIFASSCETFGQIVLESMASGLPIACSSKSSMKEIVKDGCIYFNPLEVNQILTALETLLDSTDLRSSIAKKAYTQASNFSWEKTSIETFNFLAHIDKKYR